EDRVAVAFVDEVHPEPVDDEVAGREREGPVTRVVPDVEHVAAVAPPAPRGEPPAVSAPDPPGVVPVRASSSPDRRGARPPAHRGAPPPASVPESGREVALSDVVEQRHEPAAPLAARDPLDAGEVGARRLAHEE